MIKYDVNRRKGLFITTVRIYLNQHRIKYKEYESSTGSYYFHLDLDNLSNPCIRISDHRQSSNKYHAQTLLYNVGLNTNSVKTQEKINRTIKNTINSSRAYSTSRFLC